MSELTCVKCGLVINTTNYAKGQTVQYTCAKCRGNATPKKVSTGKIKKEAKKKEVVSSVKTDKAERLA